jgi:hypothetical protein
MGMKEMRIVWMRNIHLPLTEVGLNLQMPFEISWMVVEPRVVRSSGW